MDDATAVQVSGAGVHGEGPPARPNRCAPQEIDDLRGKLQKLKEKTPKTADDEKEIQSHPRSAREGGDPRPRPVLAENVIAEVTIEKAAPPGPRELRLRARTGLSNPVVFDVGQLPGNPAREGELRPRSAVGHGGQAARPGPQDAEIAFTLPAVLNSQLLPGQVDRYRFHARKDQQLVFRTRARALVPYLADAVPGWVHAVLTLYDADGNELACNDGYGNTPDPVIAYKVPADGEYVLEIQDALYRGREDFVYRIEAGELPYITSVFPLGGRAGDPRPRSRWKAGTCRKTA